MVWAVTNTNESLFAKSFNWEGSEIGLEIVAHPCYNLCLPQGWPTPRLMFDIISKQLNKESSCDDGGNVRCAVQWFATQVNELSVGGPGRITSMWFSCDLRFVIGNGGGGDHRGPQCKPGPGELHQLWGDPPSPGDKTQQKWLLARLLEGDYHVQLIVTCISYLQIDQQAHQIHSLFRINFCASRCKRCQTQNIFSTWPEVQVSILPPFVILNGRKVLIKQRVMALDKRKSPFHQEGSQAWGVDDLAPFGVFRHHCTQLRRN